MLPTRRELLRLAAETRFEAAILEKALRLGDVLAEIGRHRRLSSALVLKGGTALNLFFGPPSRLSVDLDFNYVGHLDRVEAERERPIIEADLERIGNALGYTVQRSRDAHAGRTFYLSYQRTLDGLRDRVEIDVNFLHRQPLLAPTQRRMWRPGDAPGCEFPTLAFDELASGKLGAFVDRTAPRDAWDVARLPGTSGETWPTSRSRALFVAIAGVLPHPLYSYAGRGLSSVSDAEVRRQLHPLLVADARPTGAELGAAAEAIVEPLLDLTPREKEYCDRLQRGELAPELLFPDEPEIASRLAASPPLLWKAENARRFHANRG
jgi:hypothetical protein